MGKYKNIKSLAHNIGYSFLSDMNHVSEGGKLTMIADAIYLRAKAGNHPLVRVDLTTGAVEPDALATPPIRQAVAAYVAWLPRLAESQSVAPAMIRRGRIALRFDFGAARPSRYEPDREIPAVECTVEIIDDRGVSHIARPDHWCYAR